VAPGGYRWWYLDALSDDGRHGLALIVFVGSVFSPYYAAARRRAAPADPLEHCAVNVALYDRAGRARWAMTERAGGRVTRGPDTLQIGPSALSWQRGVLTICLDEVTVPWPSRIQGVVRLDTGACVDHPIALDGSARHRWSMLAPCARVEVALRRPGLAWSGPAYLDTNWGDEPLERGFARWDWTRAHLRDGSTVVLYDVQRRDDTRHAWALRVDTAGRVSDVTAPPRADLPRTSWRVPRSAHSDAGHTATVLQTLEDGPFYARSLVDAHWFGERVTAVHESVSLQRFERRWVQALLPFRMPRRAG